MTRASAAILALAAALALAGCSHAPGAMAPDSGQGAGPTHMNDPAHPDDADHAR